MSKFPTNGKIEEHITLYTEPERRPALHLVPETPMVPSWSKPKLPGRFARAVDGTLWVLARPAMWLGIGVIAILHFLFRRT